MATKKTIGKEQAEAVKIAPFRMFGKIVDQWVDAPEHFGDARFFVRSMTVSERAMSANAETISRNIRDVAGAYERAGTSYSEVFESDEKLVSLWPKVHAKFLFDEEAEARFVKSKRTTVLACVSRVEIDGIETAFGAEEYDSISSVDVADWLFDEVKRQSIPTEAERVSL